MNDLLHRMARVRVPYHQIALALGLSLKTLLSLHGPEMQRAAITADFEMRETLFTMAKSGKNTAATIYWLKTYSSAEKKSPEKSKQPAPPVIQRLPRVRFIGPNGEIVE